MLPVTASFDCRIGASSFLCDPLSAVWLTPETAYRMRRPWRNQRSWSIVVDERIAPARRSYIPVGVQSALLRWRAEQAAGQCASLQLEERLVALVQAIVAPGDEQARSPHRAVERTREYFAASPESNDTLDGIARTVHCSPFHLARMFRRHTGRSLHRYRTELRMTRALSRLEQGESDLGRLAVDLGYSSHSHFTSTFRRTFGITPHQMRTNLTAPGLAI